VGVLIFLRALLTSYGKELSSPGQRRTMVLLSLSQSLWLFQLMGMISTKMMKEWAMMKAVSTSEPFSYKLCNCSYKVLVHFFNRAWLGISVLGGTPWI